MYYFCKKEKEVLEQNPPKQGLKHNIADAKAIKSGFRAKSTKTRIET